MLIEIHAIQNHSPANLNRDDLGAPKTCYFGGVMRSRISSQCIKRSIRNPGNADDIHNRGPGLFATAMAGHMGTKTKLFPWLVGEKLKATNIPEDEHPRIILAAQRIGASKEKEDKKGSQGAKSDPRPKTAQLIHLGPGHAELFVQKLATLREEQKDCYKYFLNPKVGFEELIANELAESGLEEKDQKRIVKASWVIAKCRMEELLKAPGDQESETEPALVGGQPGEDHAKLIASKLTNIHADDEERFKNLTKNPSGSGSEKEQVKEDAPEKPKKIKNFMGALKEVHCHDAVDIALFGRMTTSDAFEDVEAAMQVAHAISTHAASIQVDYFTAVDDLGKGVGAGHVGEAMFTSACFYKYFCLDWNQLVSNLAGPQPDEKKDKVSFDKWTSEIKPAAEKLAAAALGHLIRALAMTTPSGKQNTFAAHNEPCGILVEIKDSKTPTSYANAFAEPAGKIGDPPDDAADCVSLLGRSIAQFGDHVYSLRRAYESRSTLLWYAHQPWRYPLQGWEREEDGRKAKVRDEKGQPTKQDKPPVKFASKCLDILGGEENGRPGLVEAVIEALGIKWADVKDAGKTAATEA